MLSKHTAIEITKDNPFANDKLERKIIAENLTRLIESTNQPFVISIEAPWGWGKTTFINMWKMQLETQGHTCLYFNAWENDFVEDPLIAFIGEISKALSEKKHKGKLKSHLKKLQDIGGKIVRRSIPLAIQIGTQGLLSQDSVKKVSDIVFASSDEIANFTSEFAKEKIQQYENDKHSIIEFKRELASFAKSLSEEENQKTPLVFFVDELDRCRPDFALSLLERVKHIFSVEGVVFILSLDRKQIEQSIKSLYGQEMDEDGYLRRFIDFRFQLPRPSIENLCKSLHNHFHLNELFNARKNEDENLFIKSFLRFAETYNFSLRIIEQCYSEMNFLLRTTPGNHHMNSDIVAFLVAFKVINPNQFTALSLKINYTNIKNIVEELKNKLNFSDRFDRWLLIEIEAYLIFSCSIEGEKERIYADLRKKSEDITKPPTEEQKYADALMSSLQGYAYSSNRVAITQLLNRYNMLEQLMLSNS